MSRASDSSNGAPRASDAEEGSPLSAGVSGVRSSLDSTRTTLATLRAADLTALVRAREQLETIRVRLGALREAVRACDPSAQAESSALRARRAELSRLCERGVLAVYAQVLLNTACGREVSVASVQTIDRRYGYQTARDPIVVATRALRVADGREEMPTDEWLGYVLSQVSASQA